MDKKSFSIGNELSRPDNAGNLNSKKDNSKLNARLTMVLSEYEELADELKDMPNVRYCAGLAYRAAGNWQAAADEFARAMEVSGNKDNDAKQALNFILTMALYL